MKVILLFIILFQFYHVNADEIYNLIKIPNLEIYKLKNENNIRYLNAKGDFKIGVNDNITCKKTNQENLNTKFPVIERNIKRYNSKFLKKINLKYIVFCESLYISNINTGGIPDNKNRTLIIDIKFNEKYFERVIHHEVFHIINDSYKEIFDEKEWSNFNIENFEYADCSTCTDKIGLETYKNTDGFLTEYSRSTASEDMAEVFSHLIIGLSIDKNDNVLQKKIQFIRNNLLKIDQNFKL